MDKRVTPLPKIAKKSIQIALQSECYGAPSVETIDFIRSFASGIRCVERLPEELAIYSLN